MSIFARKLQQRQQRKCTEDNPTSSTDGIIATDNILVDPSYADTIYHNYRGDSTVTFPIHGGGIEEGDANEAV